MFFKVTNVSYNIGRFTKKHSWTYITSWKLYKNMTKFWIKPYLFDPFLEFGFPFLSFFPSLKTWGFTNIVYIT